MNRLARIHAAVSRIPAGLFLAAYLTAIPAFAIVYCALPGQQFYAPYAKFEPGAQGDVAAVTESVRQAISQSVGTHFPTATGWKVGPSSTVVQNLAAEPSGRASFTLAFVAERFEDGRKVEQTSGPQMSVLIGERRIILPAPPSLYCHPVTISGPAQTQDPYTPDAHLFFRPPDASIGSDAICWDASKEKEFLELQSGWSGDPRMLSGFPWRMAYFSATTITTVGFGDIVPLAGAARFFVGIEAVAGWLLAGFFLNAVASRAARRRQADDAR